MKWFAQYFISPLLAALVALLGTYHYMHKSDLSKEYTKIGVDIVLKEDSPKYMREYAYQLIEQNSPVKIAEPKNKEKLENLLREIPANFEIISSITYEEVLIRLIVLHRWAAEVRSLCPECINVNSYKRRYSDIGKKLTDVKRKERSQEIKKLVSDTKISRLSLSGLWKTASKIDDKVLLLEFLDDGVIRSHAGLSGKSYIFENQRWVAINNQLVIETDQEGKTIKDIGVFKQGKIVGFSESISGYISKWELVPYKTGDDI